MKVFVAGATGVLGSRVVPELVAQGHDVTAVARTPEKAAALRQQGAAQVEVDLFDPQSVMRAVDGADVVINLATAIPSTARMWRTSAWEMTSRLRSEASHLLVDAALATGATRYIQEALGFVYPDHGDAWIDEEARLDPPPYAAAVLNAETEVRRFTGADTAGVALRFGLFYSADSAQTRAVVGTARRGLLALPGRPEGYQSWVHVDDAAAAVVAALEVPAGAYNIVEDEPLTNAAHAQVFSELLGRRVRGLPPWAGIGGPFTLQVRSQRVSNRRFREVSTWRPAFPSRREGWASVISELDAQA